MRPVAVAVVALAACTPATLEPAREPQAAGPTNLAGEPIAQPARPAIPHSKMAEAPTEPLPENPYQLTEQQKMRLLIAQTRARVELDRAERCKGHVERERAAQEGLKARARAAIAWANEHCDFTVEPPFNVAGICPPTCEVIHLPAQSLYSRCRDEQPTPDTLRLANLTINGKLSAVALPTDGEDCDP